MASYKQSEYEVLRRRCVELNQAGWKQGPIAQALGLTQGWVSQTLKKYGEQGASALQWRKPTGAPTRLTAEQLHQLVGELKEGAEYYGFAGAVWTRPRINEVIKKLFGVSYDPSQVGRILKKVGGSRQKPQAKARQQDPVVVAQWPEERLPELKKSERGGTGSFIYRGVSLLLITPVSPHMGTLRSDTSGDRTSRSSSFERSAAHIFDFLGYSW